MQLDKSGKRLNTRSNQRTGNRSNHRPNNQRVRLSQPQDPFAFPQTATPSTPISNEPHQQHSQNAFGNRSTLLPAPRDPFAAATGGSTVFDQGNPFQSSSTFGNKIRRTPQPFAKRRPKSSGMQMERPGLAPLQTAISRDSASGTPFTGDPFAQSTMEEPYFPNSQTSLGNLPFTRDTPFGAPRFGATSAALAHPFGRQPSSQKEKQNPITQSAGDPFASLPGANLDAFGNRESIGLASRLQPSQLESGAEFRMPVAPSGHVNRIASERPPATSASRIQRKPRTGESSHQLNQLLIKSVPVPLFSRSAIQDHFSQIPGLNVTNVSLRGSRHVDSRRTALVSFASGQEATLALTQCRTYNGRALNVVLFRPIAPQREFREQPPESNELVFSFVPRELGNEEIKALFNNISENGVLNVSVKERSLRNGSMKRTAIITFMNSASAANALRNLPLYNGEKLNVSFRQIPQHLARSAEVNRRVLNEDEHKVSAEGSDKQWNTFRSPNTMAIEPVTNPSLPRGDRRNDVLEAGEEDNFVPLSGFGSQDNHRKSDGLNFSNHAEKTGLSDSDVQLRSSAAQRQVEIAELKAAIRQKEIERSLLKQRQKEKVATLRKQKPIPAQEKSDKQDNGGSWRTVGEKLDIDNAVQFVGTCRTMCPTKEFADRVEQRDISIFEMSRHGGELQPDPSRAVKKYRRSAAVSEEPSSEEVRPPDVLAKTMEHLKAICDENDAEFHEVHNFVRDRTRSIRQDFTLQGIRNESCIGIIEESVRFHIMSEHRLHGTDSSLFSSKQNLEQLDKCLISLREMYDLRREMGLHTSPNEPEMQAYYMLRQMSDPKACVQMCSGFVRDVYQSVPVQFALEVVRSVSEPFGSFTKYFSCVRAAPYLTACLLHSRFVHIRSRALAIINSTHGNPNGKDFIEVPTLTRMLAFEDDSETVGFCSVMGMEIDQIHGDEHLSGVTAIVTPSPDFDEENSSKWSAKKSKNVIETKSRDLAPSEIISGVGKDQFSGFHAPHKKPQYPQTAKGGGLGTETEKVNPLGTSLKPRLAAARCDELVKPGDTSQPTNPLSTTALQSKGEAKASKLHSEYSISADERHVTSPTPILRTSKQKSDGDTVRSTAERRISFAPSVFLKHTKQTDRVWRPEVAEEHEGEAALKHDDKREPGDTVPPPHDADEDALRVVEQERREREERLRREEAKEQEREQERRKEQAKRQRRGAKLEQLRTCVQACVDECSEGYDYVQELIGEDDNYDGDPEEKLGRCDVCKGVLNAVCDSLNAGFGEVEAARQWDWEGEMFPISFFEELDLCRQLGNSWWDQIETYRRHALSSIRSRPQRTPGVSRLRNYGAQSSVVTSRVPEIEPLPNLLSELEAVSQRMQEEGAIQWQAAVVNVPCDNVENGVANTWVQKRLETKFRINSRVISLLNPTNGGRRYLSVVKTDSSSGIPATACAVVCCFDAGNYGNFGTVKAALEKTLRKGRDGALSKNFAPPSLIILCFREDDIIQTGFEKFTTGRSTGTALDDLVDHGFLSHIDLVYLSKDSVLRCDAEKKFTLALEESVVIRSEVMMEMGLELCECVLGQRLVDAGNSAWMDVLLTCNPSMDMGSKNVEVIEAINDAWSGISDLLKREEERWPEEITSERTSLRKSSLYVQQTMRLPYPTEISVKNTAEYIEKIALLAGVSVPPVRPSGTMRVIAQFCRALGCLMMPFVANVMGSQYQNAVILPKVKSRPDTKTVHRILERKFNLSCAQHSKASRTMGIEVGELLYPETMRPMKRRRSESNRTRKGWSESNLGIREYIPERLSLNEARREISYSPIRRLSLPTVCGRRKMGETYDMLIREEEAFAELLEETMRDLESKRRRVESSSSKVGLVL